MIYAPLAQLVEQQTLNGLTPQFDSGMVYTKLKALNFKGLGLSPELEN